jgi:hypothetical protein
MLNFPASRADFERIHIGHLNSASASFHSASFNSCRQYTVWPLSCLSGKISFRSSKNLKTPTASTGDRRGAVGPCALASVNVFGCNQRLLPRVDQSHSAAISSLDFIYFSDARMTPNAHKLSHGHGENACGSQQPTNKQNANIQS